MAKILVTFGQEHAHVVNGKVFNKDTVARLDCVDHADGRRLAFEFFGNKFFTTYNEDGSLTREDIARYFPLGIVDVEEPDSPTSVEVRFKESADGS